MPTTAAADVRLAAVESYLEACGVVFDSPLADLDDNQIYKYGQVTMARLREEGDDIVARLGQVPGKPIVHSVPYDVFRKRYLKKVRVPGRRKPGRAIVLPEGFRRARLTDLATTAAAGDLDPGCGYVARATFIKSLESLHIGISGFAILHANFEFINRQWHLRWRTNNFYDELIVVR